MASRTPNEALLYVKKFVKNMTVDGTDTGVRILDDANKMLWMAAPWRWTLGAFPTFNLSSNTSDYTVSTPADFLFLVKAFVHDGTTTPSHLHVEPFLHTSVGYVGNAKQVYVTGNTVRLSPKPGTLVAPTKTFYGIYKKTAPDITSGNKSNAGVLVMDDEWFWVYTQGVLYFAYLYADDARAGGAVVQGGNVQYSGQLGVFQAGIAVMKQHEKLPLMEPGIPNPEMESK